MQVSLKEIDIWLFKGMSGLVNMLIARIMFDHGFGKTAQQIFSHEMSRLEEVREEVSGRGIEEYPPGVSSIDVVDGWFMRSFAGIDSWIWTRSQDGPKMCESNLQSIEQHIEKLREVVRRERAKT